MKKSKYRNIFRLVVLILLISCNNDENIETLSLKEKAKKYVEGYLINYSINLYTNSVNRENFDDPITIDYYKIYNEHDFEGFLKPTKIQNKDFYDKFVIYSIPVKYKRLGDINFLIAFDNKSRTYFLNGFDSNQFQLFLYNTQFNTSSYYECENVVNFYCNQLIKKLDYFEVNPNELSIDSSFKDKNHTIIKYFYNAIDGDHDKYIFTLYEDKSINIERRNRVKLH